MVSGVRNGPFKRLPRAISNPSVFGRTKCKVCGEPAVLKIDGHGYLYSYCHTGKGCRSRIVTTTAIGSELLIQGKDVAVVKECADFENYLNEAKAKEQRRYETEVEPEYVTKSSLSDQSAKVEDKLHPEKQEEALL